MHTQSTTEIETCLTEDKEPTEVTNPTLDEITKTDEKLPTFKTMDNNYPEQIKKRIKDIDDPP